MKSRNVASNTFSEVLTIHVHGIIPQIITFTPKNLIKNIGKSNFSNKLKTKFDKNVFSCYFLISMSY